RNQKILFFRILPAPAPVFRFAPDGMKEGQSTVLDTVIKAEKGGAPLCLDPAHPFSYTSRTTKALRGEGA
ncbi:MAG: hypothetical protein K2J64_03075, partial [Desulfovibrio sp.]|nr:hypothetical protein [Desulfovibrio sp.]